MSHHVEGVEPLKAVLDAGFPVHAIITLDDDLLAKRSGAAHFDRIAADHSVPLHRIRNVNNPDALTLLEQLHLDVLFVIGWSQILRASALEKIRIGCFGAHASLLPTNRGSAPINWSLIKGETLTGNTLMRLDVDVDAGDIVAQTPIPITPFDNVATLYDRVADSNRVMILNLLDDLCAGKPLQTQTQTDLQAPLLPRRRPDDGLLNWNQPAADVYNFIRALTRPYPGAYSHHRDERLLIWNSALLPFSGNLGTPGTVVGSVVSDSPGASGLAVACSVGAVLLLEVETSTGHVCSDKDLARSGYLQFTDRQDEQE